MNVFVSKFWNPGSNGIDAFSYNWYGKNGLFVPPVYLITRVLRYMEFCNAYGTLVLPKWKSGRYWPILCPDGITFIPAVREVQMLPNYYGAFETGTNFTIYNVGAFLSFQMIAF